MAMNEGNVDRLGQKLFQLIMDGNAPIPEMSEPMDQDQPSLPNPMTMQQGARPKDSLFKRVRSKAITLPPSETQSGKMPLGSFPKVRSIVEGYRPQMPQMYNPLSAPRMPPQRQQAFMVAPNMMRM